jgi:serine/threonine protein kinase
VALKVSKPKLTAVGPYQILGLIGEGAMGAVYKARHQDGGDEVAVKVLPPDLAANPVRLKRFEQEFRAAKVLSHPNIVSAIDFGNHEGTPYFVMEFVEGPSLAARIGRDGKIPEAEAVALIVQVAEALHQAHAQGIIHRDVKPDNVLLTTDGRAKLADLGLAKDQAADLDLTRPNSGLGTPNYMAPEQFTNAKNADPRCDVYSLGATLYVALTSELPFRGRTPLHVLKKKTKNELTPPRKLVPNLSERVERAMLRAMCVEPGQRHPTCLAFAADLQGQAVDEIDLAISPSQQARPRVAIPLATKSKGAERRATVRYATNHDGFAKPLAGDAESHWAAKVVDLSEGGIKLVLPRRFEPKAVLIVELPGEGEAKPRKMLVRVVRVRKQGEGQWAMGCKFARNLSAEERELLV